MKRLVMAAALALAGCTTVRHHRKVDQSIESVASGAAGEVWAVKRTQTTTWSTATTGAAQSTTTVYNRRVIVVDQIVICRLTSSGRLACATPAVYKAKLTATPAAPRPAASAEQPQPAH